MLCLYDMSVGSRGMKPSLARPTTFDFFNWLVHVWLLGATEIAFKIEPMNQAKFPIAESLKRFRNYIWPGCALAGLPCSVKSEGDGSIGSVLMCDLLEDLKKSGKE